MSARKNETPEQREARLVRQREANARYISTPEGRAKKEVSTQRYRATPAAREKAAYNAKAWRSRNPERVRRNRRAIAEQGYFRADHRRRTYGLAPEAYEAMLQRQNFACAVCGSSESNRVDAPGLVVDHCHLTKRVRGLLCSTCNSGMGHLRDDPALLLKAADYLLKDNLRNHG